MPSDTKWKKKLYEIIFEADTFLGKTFDVLLLWAILLSVASVLLESDRSLSQQYGSILIGVEWFFTILFTIEYLLRLICVKKTSQYIKSFFGVVDFIAIAPTYLSLLIPGTQYLMVTRAFRLLRVFRILKLTRYSQESQVLLKALKASRIKITVFIGTVLTIILIMGTLMHLVESENPGFTNIFEGMYWAVVTMTTVGYGDAVPVTVTGKFIASIIMILGYAILAVPTGIVSSELTNISRDYKSALACQKCYTPLLAKSKFCHQCGDKTPKQ